MSPVADSVLTVLAYTLVPVAATVVAGVVATLRPPGLATRGVIQHLAAGILFAVIAGELLPDLMHERALLATLIGFAAGTGLMLGVKEATSRLTAAASNSAAKVGPAAATPSRGSGTSLIITVAIDMFIDGLMLGVGFAAGAKTGLLLGAALTLELVFLGLSAAAQLAAGGTPRGRSVAIVAGLGSLALVGSGLGAALLANLQPTALAGVVAFGTAALLYLVTEELLVEAHEQPETPLLAATFFAGFLMILLAEIVV